MAIMQIILIIAIAVAAALVLFALVRGLVLFSQSHRDGDDAALMANYANQNKMMFSRVKWQAVTVLLLVVIGMVAAAG